MRRPKEGSPARRQLWENGKHGKRQHPHPHDGARRGRPGGPAARPPCSWRWLPSTGRGPTVEILGVKLSILHWGGLRYALLPAVDLALFKLSLIIRLTRAQVREQSLLDYIKFARAKGLSNRRVIGVHLLKNIMIPLVTVIGLELGSVIAFAVVTETIFAWPGMGKLVFDSIFQLDRPVVVAYLLVVVFMFIVINLVVDLLYSILDPRVRLADVKS